MLIWYQGLVALVAVVNLLTATFGQPALAISGGITPLLHDLVRRGAGKQHALDARCHALLPELCFLPALELRQIFLQRQFSTKGAVCPGVARLRLLWPRHLLRGCLRLRLWRRALLGLW